MSRPSRPDAPVLQSRFRLDGRPLLFARAVLFPDRLVLTGWSWRGRYRRTIRLADVASAAWWSGGDADQPNFTLALQNGASLRLRLLKAGLWRSELHGLGVDVGQAAPLPDARRTSASAA